MSADDLRHANCRYCGQTTRCFPQGVSDQVLERFSAVLVRRRPLAAREPLFRQNAPFTSVYLLRAGSFKTVAVDEDGQERVLEFYLPGDLLGLDASGEGRYRSSAVALERSRICELSFPGLDRLCGDIETFRKQLNRAFGDEIVREQQLLRLLQKKSAEQRLAGFLLQLARRFDRRGHRPGELCLSMSRQDIGDHLGLALETVSRLMKKFHRQGVLRVERRRIDVLDGARLAALAADAPSGGTR